MNLVGPGGTTRLATTVAEAAARSFPFGGAFVDLMPVRDGFVEQAVAAALGMVERPQQPLADAVLERQRRSPHAARPGQLRAPGRGGGRLR